MSEYMLNIIIHSDTFGKDNLTDMTCQGINKSSQTNDIPEPMIIPEG